MPSSVDTPAASFIPPDASRSRTGRSTTVRLRRALSFRNISAIYVFIGLFILYSIWVPHLFLTTTTLQTLLSNQAITGIVAVGLVLPLAAGAFDLSVGLSVGIGSILVAWLVSSQGIPIVPACLIAVASGTVIGLVNSLLVTVVGINSFIATLGISSVLTAVAQAITNNQPIVNLPDSFQNFSTDTIFGVALPVFYLLVLALILWYVLEHTPIGRYVYATGGNPEAARLSGVPTRKVIAASLVATATIAAFAGILLSSQLASASPDNGPSYLLPAFAAAFLGSTQIKNGRYNVWGTVIAVYVLATGVQGLLLAGAPLWLPQLFNGVVLILAVGLSIQRRRAQVRGSEERAASALHTAPEESTATGPLDPQVVATVIGPSDEGDGGMTPSR